MIGSLRGQVLERELDATVLVEVGGVGYLVQVTQRTAAELEPGTSCFLYIHHQVREDAQTLFGFVHRNERAAFRSLIATHGVGPALAMAILATHTPEALTDVIANGDLTALTLVPGVGKKTAERLLVELRSRFSLPMIDAAGTNGSEERGSVLGDVREALSGLGYGPDEIREVLRELTVAETTEAADLLRDALKALGSRRA